MVGLWQYEFCCAYNKSLRVHGGLHKNFQKIDFLFVSHRGDRYLSDTFGPTKKIVPSRSYNQLEVSTTIVLRTIYNYVP